MKGRDGRRMDGATVKRRWGLRREAIIWSRPIAERCMSRIGSCFGNILPLHESFRGPWAFWAQAMTNT